MAPSLMVPPCTVPPNLATVQKGLRGRSRVGDWGRWFRVQGLGFRVQGLRFRVQGLGFRVQGLRFRV